MEAQHTEYLESQVKPITTSGRNRLLISYGISRISSKTNDNFRKKSLIRQINTNFRKGAEKPLQLPEGGGKSIATSGRVRKINSNFQKTTGNQSQLPERCIKSITTSRRVRQISRNFRKGAGNQNQLPEKKRYSFHCV